ncbi:MAG: hypothetical protein WD018_06525 [Nitrosopumilaceae archaeon]
MNKGQKYDSFYDKVVDYHKRKLLIRIKNAEKDKQGKYTKEYKTLVKAKKDILDKTKDVFDGALTFSELATYGDLSKSAREQWSRAKELSEDDNLKDYIFRDENESIKFLLSDAVQQFIMTVFNDKTIDRLLSAIFFFGISTKQSNESETYQRSKNYRIVMAKKMIKKGINELRQYLPLEWKDFLIPKLDEAIMICDTINKSADEIEQERIRKQILEHRRRR